MKILIILVLTFLSASAFAQYGELSFKNKKLELKNLKADNVPTQVSFEFKNTGQQPVIISRVSPMMSLIKAEWDKAPIAPGASSSIKISFPTVDMPEKFDYTITVLSNASQQREQLQIVANIVDNPAKPDLLYKYNLEGVKFKTTNISLDQVFYNQTVKDTLYFFNNREKPVKMGTRYTASYIKVDFIPQEVAVGKKGMAIITFNAAQKNEYGYTYEYIILSYDSSDSYQNRLTLSANITEDFSKLSAKELANAPIAFVEKKDIAFGETTTGEKVTCDFILENKGKTNLIIRKTKTSCGCTAIAQGEQFVAPGGKTTIRATFDSAGRTGRQYKSITVITNDPKNPEMTLNISGNILDKK